MKQVLHFCSKIKGYFSALQSNDVGYDCRLTVVRPSFGCRSTMLKLVSILFILLTLGIGNAWGDTYSWTLTTTDFGTTASPATTLSSKGSPAKNWSASYTWSKNKYIGTSLDGTRGAQVGAKPDNSSNNRHVTSLVLSTSGISGTISDVTVHTAGAKGTNATIGVSVGGTTFKYEGNNTASLTKDDASYSFTGSSSGTITITWSQSSALALYVKSIEVTYSAAASCSNDPSVGAASLNGSFSRTIFHRIYAFL